MTQKRLRVALLSLQYPPDKIDGMARCTNMLARGLLESGHEVHVVKEGIAGKTTYYDGACIHEVRTNETRRYRNYFYQDCQLTHKWLNSSHTIFECVQSLLADYNIQIVDTQNYQLEGLVTAVSRAVPVVVRLSTSIKQIVEITGQNNADNYLVGELEKKMISLSQGIVANSHFTSHTLADVYDIDFEKMQQPVIVIHHGIKPIPEAKVIPIANIPKPNPTILFVGRLEKRKGILDLFNALTSVLKIFPDAQVWIVGQDNSDEDGFKAKTGLNYPTYFQRHYTEYSSNVRFLGFVSDVNLSQVYQICDLLVVPSLYESFGLVYLEAMNHARPVIGCSIGGPTEIISDGETGYLVPPQSPKELSAAIIRLLEDPKLRQEMGQAGRQRLLDHFTYKKMAANYANFYRNLLA